MIFFADHLRVTAYDLNTTRMYSWEHADMDVNANVKGYAIYQHEELVFHATQLPYAKGIFGEVQCYKRGPWETVLEFQHVEALNWLRKRSADIDQERKKAAKQIEIQDKIALLKKNFR